MRGIAPACGPDPAYAGAMPDEPIEVSGNIRLRLSMCAGRSKLPAMVNRTGARDGAVAQAVRSGLTVRYNRP
jgi:hypothetical protein